MHQLFTFTMPRRSHSAPSGRLLKPYSFERFRFRAAAKDVHIDIRFFRDLFFSVQVIRRVLAVVLVALWVPATLHCAFEAAGFENWFNCHEEVASSTDHCTDDACQPLESFAYKSDTGTVRIQPPASIQWSEWLIQLAPTFVLLTNEAVVRPTEPPPLTRPWQFIQRAAPPVRAPGMTA